MSPFRSGRFIRSKVPGGLDKFCPTEALYDLEEVDLELQAKAGKKVVLLDVDNTLLPWRSEDIPQSTFDWIAKGKALGLKFCIISNTRKRARLQRLAARMDVPFVQGRFKPSRKMYQQALDDLGVQASEAVMVGDQLFTDILGANRSGIDAIWVKPMGRKELVLTKFNRFFERLIRRMLYSFMEDPDEARKRSYEHQETWADRPVVRQFVKFCVVGGSSTVIDLGLHWLLMFNLMWGPELLSERFGTQVIEAMPFLGRVGTPWDISFTLFKFPTACLAILNSFYWNRRWTFNIKDAHERHIQLAKFFAIALTGMALNVVIMSAVNAVMHSDRGLTWKVASAIATVLVAFWNFLGHKLWTFKRKASA